jgi:hypothetical protein
MIPARQRNSEFENSLLILSAETETRRFFAMDCLPGSRCQWAISFFAIRTAREYDVEPVKRKGEQAKKLF